MDSQEHRHTDGEHDVSLEDLAAFASMRADEATRQRVKAAMLDIRHPLSYLVRTEEEVRAGKPPSLCVDEASERVPVSQAIANVFRSMSTSPKLPPGNWECPQEWIEEGRKVKRQDFERVLRMKRSVPLKIRVRVVGALNTPSHPVIAELEAEGFPLHEVRSKLRLDEE